MSAQENEDLVAAEYVLGLTDDATRQSLDKRLNEDAAFAAEVLHWQKAFSGPDRITPTVAPAPGVWQRIERDLSRAASTASAPRTSAHPGFWLGWGLAAALAGFLIVSYVTRPDVTPALQPVAVLSGAQPDAQFVVSLDKSASLIEVSALNITLPADKNFELWLIKGSAAPQSLGLIARREGNAFKLPAGALDNQTVLAVSLEPLGGSKQAGPSGPVVFQGRVTLL
ncbi:anti-sigma factor [uncultured Pantoea sp.]|uniref:anti-sigma factor n=1 Tax=uncultured Pantoea sp. TaxID=218084 RepID=UPI00258F1AEE|nr:anti-sigma factor [uncultured Pantoea sp.]